MERSVKHFVYYLFDIAGLLAYVGRSCTPSKRRTVAQRKFGEIFTMQLSAPMCLEDACVMELAEIDRYKPRLNKRLVSSPGNTGCKMPESAKQAVSRRQKGKVISAEQRELLSIALRGRKQDSAWVAKRVASKAGYTHTEKTRGRIGIANTGKKHTEETKAEMSRTRTGKKRSKETCLRISVAKMGHEVSKESRKKISIGNLGKVISVEHRAQISAALTGKPMSAGTKKSLTLWNEYQGVVSKTKRGEHITVADKKIVKLWESRPPAKHRRKTNEDRKELLQSGWGHPWRLQSLEQQTQDLVAKLLTKQRKRP